MPVTKGIVPHKKGCKFDSIKSVALKKTLHRCTCNTIIKISCTLCGVTIWENLNHKCPEFF